MSSRVHWSGEACRLLAVWVIGLSFIPTPSLWAQTVIGWGNNSFGQISIPAAATNVVDIATGLRHSLALRADGTVVSWGNGTVAPTNITTATAIAAGGLHSLALLADGTVVAWGDNSLGQTNVPPAATNVVTIAAGRYHNLALRANGTIVAWGSNWIWPAPVTLSNVVAISAGDDHSLALIDDGSLVRWRGSDFFDVVTNKPSVSPQGVVAMSSAGSSHNVGLTTEGRPLVWGSLAGLPIPASATNILTVAAGQGSIVTLRADGQVIAWGNHFGVPITNIPPSLTNIVAVSVFGAASAGSPHGLALTGPVSPKPLSRVVFRSQVSAGDELPLMATSPGLDSLHFSWFTNGVLAASGTNLYWPRIPEQFNTNEISSFVIVSNNYGAVTSLVGTVRSRPINFWGNNGATQLEIPPNAHEPLGVWAGASHSLALGADGGVIAWGKNSDGQLNTPATASNVVALAGGSFHSLALRNDGRVVAWGRNWNGQTNVPPSATNVIAIDAGYAHSIALRADGTVVAWGDNEFGQCANSYLALEVVAISAGYYHNLALRSDGKVVSWGLYEDVPPGATNVVGVAAGWGHNLAVRSDGTVLAWGDNTYGQCDVPANATNVVAVRAGWYHSAALRADGTVVAWGKNAFGVTKVPPHLKQVSALVLGEDFSGAVVNGHEPQFGIQHAHASASLGGQLVLHPQVRVGHPANFQWYHNGVAIVGATNQHLWLPSLSALSGGDYVLAVTNAFGGAVSEPINIVVSSQPATLTAVGAWGDNLMRQLDTPPGLENPRAVAAGALHSLALQADGTVRAWGNNSDGQTNVPGTLANALAIAAGSHHSIALRADGTVVAWGRNWDGQTNVPPSVTNAVAVAAGAAHSVALRGDGQVIAWGKNYYGQTNVPAFNGDIIAIAAGYHHNLALRDDFKLFAWGSQTTVPAAASNVVAIAAGWEHNLALRADGVVVAWGDNSYGQCDVPPSATNIVAIAAGYGVSFAQRADGQLQAWGRGAFDLTTVPSALKNVAVLAAGENHVVALVEYGPPRFQQSPRSINAPQHGRALFATTVNGSFPLVGQWWQDGAPLSNAPSRSLWLTDLQVTNAGDYVLVVSNTVSSSSSSPATLNVSPAPAITSDPVVIRHPPERPLELRADVFGELPINLRWQLNGLDLADGARYAGTATDTLVIASTAYADSGAFSLVASNAHGAVTALVAQVQITPVVAWGDNSAGQLEIPPGVSNVVAVSAGAQHNLALRADGSVVAWGDNSAGQTNVPMTAQNVVAVAAGGAHSLALVANGTVVAWGDNTNGQRNVPVSATNIIAIAAGEAQSVALRADGAVLLWGRSSFGQPNVSITLTTNAVAIGADDRYGLFLRPDGSMSPAWINTSNLIALDGGGGHTLAMTTDGALLSLGRNYYGQTNLPAFTSGVINFSAGGDHNLVCLSDGNVLAWGANFADQTNVPALAHGAFAVAAGGAHNLALSRQTGVPLVGIQMSRAVQLGESILLVANPQSAGVAHYQWQLNGQDLAGATNAALRLSHLHWTNAGNYQVIISNALGVVIGSPVALTVVRTPLRFETSGPFAPRYTNGFHARLLGASGTGPVIVYASTNFQDWTPVFTNPPVIGTIDLEAVDAEAAYNVYRAAEVTETMPVEISAVEIDPGQQRLRLELSGLSASGLVGVLTSTNLIDWTLIHTNPPTVSPWQYYDRLDANRPQRFYRATEQR